MIYSARQPQTGYGRPIGILALEEHIPCPPGTPGNPTTFPFPVIYEVVRGVRASELRDAANPGGGAQVLQAALRLVDKGARAVVGACGLMIVHQRALAQALPVPVLTSSLLQWLLIASMLDPEAQIGVIASSNRSFSPGHLSLAGGDPRRTVIATMEDQEHFSAAVIRETGQLDFERVEAEVIGVGQGLVVGHPRVAALLLECVDLPPYAAALQRAVDLPVYDITTLVNWAAGGVRRTPFVGVY